MDKDKIKEYIVCINGGSGVIFQPMDEKYSYILTAKHIFDDINDYNQDVIINRYDPSKNTFIKLEELKLEENINYFPHKTKDIAILKIDRLTGADNLIRLDKFEEKYKFSLYGFPETRKDKTNYLDRIREDSNLTILSEKSEGKREGKLADNSTWDELVGQSGGGIFCIVGDYFYLYGIQNKIPTANECQGRIEFSPIHNFDEIIKASNGLLEPLYPKYMKDFCCLNNIIFKIEHCVNPENLKNVKAYLKTYAKSSFNAEKIITPKYILDNYKHYFEVKNRDESELLDEDMWVAFLELLILSLILDEQAQITEDYLKSIINTRRLTYIKSTHGWKRHLQEILCSEYEGLSDDGVIVLVTLGEKPNDFS